MRHDVLIGSAVVATSAVAGSALAVALGAGQADAWSGPLAVAALVLVISGAAKVHAPDAATAALAAVSLPPATSLVRFVGAAEIVLGAVALLAGGRIAAIGVALAYAAFAVVALRMSRDADARSCGCFGNAGARPGILHVAVNVAIAALAALAAATGSGGLIAVAGDTPAGGVPAIADVVLGALGVVAVLTVAADALDAAAGTGGPTTTFHLVEDRT